MINYGLTTLPAQHEACLVLGLFENQAPSAVANFKPQDLDLMIQLQSRLVEPGQLNWQAENHGRGLLILQCGKEALYNETKLTQFINTIAQFMFTQRIQSAIISLPQLSNRTPNWQIQHMLLQMESQRYQLLDYKSRNKTHYVLESIRFNLPGANQAAIADAEAIAKGVRLTRDLANTPSNICTPTYLAEQATLLAKQHDRIEVNLIDQTNMQKMGMGALLAVSRGSQEPPQLIEIHYKGQQAHGQPIVLVGKGITFDSGGISLKPPAGMEEMKFDMAGAASVLGTINACALLKLPVHVIGLLACAENMPSGSATKPGDIVTSLSGLTIEITNTDAEGRLVLADALTYAERFNPELVIDIATLTGAVIIALGHDATGFMTKDNELATMISTAADESQDKAWRLPLDPVYQELLESPIADMMNASAERIAGSVVGGVFLSNFTEKYRWAHLDVAGTAWISGKNRTATGRPVPLLVELLRQIAHVKSRIAT